MKATQRRLNTSRYQLSSLKDVNASFTNNMKTISFAWKLYTESYSDQDGQEDGDEGNQSFAESESSRVTVNEEKKALRGRRIRVNQKTAWQLIWSKLSGILKLKNIYKVLAVTVEGAWNSAASHYITSQEWWCKRHEELVSGQSAVIQCNWQDSLWDYKKPNDCSTTLDPAKRTRVISQWGNNGWITVPNQTVELTAQPNTKTLWITFMIMQLSLHESCIQHVEGMA